MGDFRRSWILWTVWSAELGPLMDCRQYSTKEFALEILAIVQEKDQDLQFSEDEDIRVIRPTGLLEMKEDSGSGAVKVEIGGTVFQPGTRNSEDGLGPRWRLFASNDLSTVLLADKDFLVKLRKEIFVIVNGRVVESERRIWIDEHDRQTKIIRIIEQKIKPGTDNRYLSVSSKFRNVWKYRGSPKYSVLQVMPYAALRSGLARAPEKSGRKMCLTPAENGNDSIPAKVAATATSLLVRAGSVPLQDEEMGEGRERNNSDHNHNVNGGSKGRGSSSYLIDEGDSDDDVQLIEDEERPVVNTSKKPAPASRREKSPLRKKYSKLYELEEELTLLCSRPKTKVDFTLLKKKHLYGIVEDVIQTHSDVKMPSNTKMYLLRISDETKSNVLVRLCTAKQSAHSRLTIFNEVGPPMSAGDIIRIHRATVQFEVFESGLREMVISTATHLNYVIFNNVLDVDAPVEHKRLARDTEVLKDGDEDLIRDLRRFTATRIIHSASFENFECPSDKEMFHDTQTSFSSDESWKVQKQQAEALDSGSSLDYEDVLSQEILPSSEEMVIVVPGSESESSGENEMLSQGGQDRSQSVSASGSPVQAKIVEEPVRPTEQDDLHLSISRVSNVEVETGQHFVLEAKIRQMETFFDEDTAVVTVDDRTMPSLNFERLIDSSEQDQRGDTAVDVVIRNISRNLELQRTLQNFVQTDTRVVLSNVRVQKRHSDGANPSYLLYIESDESLKEVQKPQVEALDSGSVAASDSPVQSKTVKESVRPPEQDDLHLTISRVSNLEVETGQHFVLEAKICQMETFFDEDATFVTVDDRTKPSLNFERLIDSSEQDQRGDTAVDVVIRNISRNWELQRTLQNFVQTDTRVVLSTVRVQKRHSDGANPSYLLYIDLESH